MHAQPAIRATLGPPPQGFAASRSYGAFGTRWLRVVSHVKRRSDVNETKITWQGEMVAGALRDRLHGIGMDLLGVTVSAVYANGSKQAFGSNLIGGPFTHRFDKRPLAKQRAGLERMIASLPHVVHSSLTFENALGRAPVLSITTDNAQAFLRDAHIRIGAGHSTPWAGEFFAVSDETGKTLRAHGYSILSQTGVGFGGPNALRARLVRRDRSRVWPEG